MFQSSKPLYQKAKKTGGGQSAHIHISAPRFRTPSAHLLVPCPILSAQTAWEGVHQHPKSSQHLTQLRWHIYTYLIYRKSWKKYTSSTKKSSASLSNHFKLPFCVPSFNPCAFWDWLNQSDYSWHPRFSACDWTHGTHPQTAWNGDLQWLVGFHRSGVK